MERNIIKIEDALVVLPPSGEIWMTQHEIARLFDCFISKVSSNIRAILKTDVLDERKACSEYHYNNGDSVDIYNIEMITTLSFRIKSKNAEVFRYWMMNKATENATKRKVLIIKGWNNYTFHPN
jgi:hypothetical protein